MSEQSHLHRSTEMENLSDLSNEEINKPFSDLDSEKKSNRALLLVDIQNDYFEGGRWNLKKMNEASENAVRLLSSCRSTGDLIVFIRHEFPTMNAPFFQPNSNGSKIHSKFQIHPNEYLITKNQINAFRETNLKEILDHHSIKHLIICGAMTNMCIDAVTRAAHDFGYQVMVIYDACACRDLEFNDQTIPADLVHSAFISSLSFGGYAKIFTTEQYLQDHQI